MTTEFIKLEMFSFFYLGKWRFLYRELFCKSINHFKYCMFFKPIKGCKPENEKKCITFWTSDLELTENWAYLSFSI